MERYFWGMIENIIGYTATAVILFLVIGSVVTIIGIKSEIRENIGCFEFKPQRIDTILSVYRDRSFMQGLFARAILVTGKWRVEYTGKTYFWMFEEPKAMRVFFALPRAFVQSLTGSNCTPRFCTEQNKKIYMDNIM